LDDERAAEGNPLALAAGELMRAFARVVVELQAGDHLPHPSRQLLAAHTAQAQAEGDVLPDIEVGKEERLLVEIDDASSLRRHRVDAAAFEPQLALVGRLQTGDDLEQRRLATPRAAKDTDGLVVRHGERSVREHRLGAERFRDPAQLQEHRYTALNRNLLLAHNSSAGGMISRQLASAA